MRRTALFALLALIRVAPANAEILYAHPDARAAGARYLWGNEVIRDSVPLQAAFAVAKAASGSRPIEIRVQKGDTLWKIAEMHYGKGQGAKYTEIVKANTPPVKNPDLIQPGWVLRLPSAA